MREATGSTVFLIVALALARRVIVKDGTADASSQGAAAFLALFPVVAVAVFAMARWVGWRG